MLFNSLEYLLFFPIVFGLYWGVLHKHLRPRNLFLLIASYVFYGWWDWRFLGLIVLSSAVDFVVAKQLELTNDSGKRKRLLGLSLLVNLGMLGVFKYFDFFAESFADLISVFGFEASYTTLKIVLPVGISFYTFQTLSYTIDVYRKDMVAERDPIAFFAYVSFFPQLVAGPIERAKSLLPQFSKRHVFDYGRAADGLKQILYGLFKKVVIADNCGRYVDMIFTSPDLYSPQELCMGAVLFAFQIYGDFSGYSDMAIGTARMFGFDLMTNFRFPYFSRDMAEFWRRWHISLSTWFRDYLYIPLGGSRGGKWVSLRNVSIVFLVSGFWHGANWTFLLWGALHALFFVPLLLLKLNRSNLEVVAHDRMLPSLRSLFSMVITFVLVTFAWVFFRADSVQEAFHYLHLIFSSDVPLTSLRIFRPEIIGLIGLFVLLEWICRREDNPLIAFRSKKWNSALYVFLLVTVALYGRFSEQTFIYFNF